MVEQGDFVSKEATDKYFINQLADAFKELKVDQLPKLTKLRLISMCLTPKANLSILLPF
jgi:hypothetical protein